MSVHDVHLGLATLDLPVGSNLQDNRAAKDLVSTANARSYGGARLIQFCLFKPVILRQFQLFGREFDKPVMLPIYSMLMLLVGTNSYSHFTIDAHVYRFLRPKCCSISMMEYPMPKMGNDTFLC